MATTLPDSLLVQKTSLTIQDVAKAKTVKIKKPRSLEWQQVNEVTWRLVDLDAPQIRIEASHGQWGGYHYPKALAYVFDVGNDWRVRVRERGKWRAFGCMNDLATAKRFALNEVESKNRTAAPR